MDNYFLERYYQRIDDSLACSPPSSQPAGPSPTRGSPLGKADSEPTLGPSKTATVAGQPPCEAASLPGGIKQANKASWGASLGRQGNPITHSDAVARTTHVQVRAQRADLAGAVNWPAGFEGVCEMR